MWHDGPHAYLFDPVTGRGHNPEDLLGTLPAITTTLLALDACHALVDVRGWPAIGRSFGVDAIAAYAGSALMVYVFAALGLGGPLYRVGFAEWMTPVFGPYTPSLAFALAFVAVWWGIVALMDRRGWHVKI